MILCIGCIAQLAVHLLFGILADDLFGHAVLAIIVRPLFRGALVNLPSMLGLSHSLWNDRDTLGKQNAAGCHVSIFKPQYMLQANRAAFVLTASDCKPAAS